MHGTKHIKLPFKMFFFPPPRNSIPGDTRLVQYDCDVSTATCKSRRQISTLWPSLTGPFR